MTSEALGGQLQSRYTARARPKCLTEEKCFRLRLNRARELQQRVSVFREFQQGGACCPLPSTALSLQSSISASRASQIPPQKNSWLCLCKRQQNQYLQAFTARSSIHPAITVAAHDSMHHAVIMRLHHLISVLQGSVEFRYRPEMRSIWTMGEVARPQASTDGLDPARLY